MTCPNCEPCEACYGMGAIAVHDPTCHSAFCVMAGGYYDCLGDYVPCVECNGAGMVNPAMQREAEYRVTLAFVIAEMKDRAGVDRIRIIARCEQAIAAAATESGAAASAGSGVVRK